MENWWQEYKFSVYLFHSHGYDAEEEMNCRIFSLDIVREVLDLRV